MNERRTNAAKFLSEYKIIADKKQIIEEQMFEIGALLRELIRSDGQNGENVDKRVASYRKLLESKFTSLNAMRGALRIRQSAIKSVLNSLPEKEREVLTRFYIEGDNKNVSDDLSYKLGFEKSHIYRLRDKALDRVSEYLDNDFSKYFWEQAAEDNTE